MCNVNLIIWLERLRKTTIYITQGNLSASEFRNWHISNAYLEWQCYNNLLSLLSCPLCCIRCGPDEERILDVVPREDGARNSG